MARITGIEIRRGRKRRVLLVDNETWRAIPVPVLRDLGLTVGEEVDLVELGESIRCLEPGYAHERALRLLGYRERSVQELRQRLLEDGYSPPVVDSTARRLRDLGLLDDTRFTASFVRQAGNRGIGAPRARRELEQRGVFGPIIDDAIASALPVEAEFDRAVILVRRWARDTEDTRRLAARLARRGFDPDVAWRAARRVVEERLDEIHADADIPLE